jgi:hypothetical protein
MKVKVPDVSNIAKTVQTKAVKHSPEILTGLGIAGMFFSVVSAVKATPKALELIENAKEEKVRKIHETTLSKTEVVKATWKCYIPTAISLGLSTTCLIAGNTVNGRRNTTLAAAYALSESALKEYQSKTLEIAGPKKEQQIKDAILKDKVEKNPVKSTEVLMTGNGETLCMDSVSGRYFKSDKTKIDATVNKLNFQLRREMFVPLNDLYYELGLPPTKLGGDLGWNVDDGEIEFYYSYAGADNGDPCMVVDYNIKPQYR